jgi:glycosyltransferase involved in cell wall biosynthesis
MKKLCVFPSDPLYRYYGKGEIKPRYYNPCNFFDEVHMITLCERDIKPEKVQTLVGEANLIIHSISSPSFFSFPLYFDKSTRLIREINPDIIKAHGALMGALAVHAGRRLHIPTMVSLHSDSSPLHNIRILGRAYIPTFVRDIISYIFVEPYVFKNVDRIVGAYEFAARRAQKFRDDVAVIYNRVYTSQFSEVIESEDDSEITIICVGRHIKGKNPENIILAINDMKNVNLLLIGNGPLTKYLEARVRDWGLKERVKFIYSVPNTEIHRYYLSSDIFAIPIKYGGICIPVLEAMAASLPIVIPKPLWESSPEVVGDIALVVENTPKGFREAFEKLIANSDLRKELGEKGRRRAMELDGAVMEEKEMQLYQTLLRRS